MPETVSKNLNNSEMSWKFLDGSTRTAVILGSFFVGKGTYLPGWKWSEHVGKQTGKSAEANNGYIISGKMMVKSADGEETLLVPGDAFELKPNHDAWVVGDEPCVSIDFGHPEKTL